MMHNQEKTESIETYHMWCRWRTKQRRIWKIAIIIILHVVKKSDESMSMIKRKTEDLEYIQMEFPVIKYIWN